MTERGGAAHLPHEYHPPVEEYLETMLSLSEEDVPVMQARIAERLGRSAPSDVEVTVEGGGEGIRVSRHLSDRLYVGVQ